MIFIIIMTESSEMKEYYNKRSFIIFKKYKQQLSLKSIKGII